MALQDDLQGKAYTADIRQQQISQKCRLLRYLSNFPPFEGDI